MDLPTCKTCGQSVLDDDAVDCPFCGSPMKGAPSAGKPAGKPAAKPAATPAAQKPGTAGKPAAAKSAQPAAPAAAAPAAALDPDDPFAVDTSAQSKAIPLATRASPARPLELICPMCEEKGYAPAKAAGQLVKCHSTTCKFPLFTAPAPKPTGPRAEVPKPNSAPRGGPSMVTIVSIVVGAVVVLGGGYAIVEMSKPTAGPSAIEQLKAQGLYNAQAGTATTGTDGSPTPFIPVMPTDGVNGKSPTQTDTPQLPSAAEIASRKRRELGAEMITAMVNSTRTAAQSRKPWCRAQIATAMFRNGDLAGAEEQLKQAQNLGRGTQFEAITPHMTMAWDAREAGNKGVFEAEVLTSAELANGIPNRGLGPMLQALDVAVGLVISGKPDQARALLAGRPGTPAFEHVAAMIEVSTAAGRFGLDETYSGRGAGEWRAPLPVGVTLALFRRGEPKLAEDWARQFPDAESSAECVGCWIEESAVSAVSKNENEKLVPLLAAAKELTGSTRLGVLSRVSSRLARSGNKTAAVEWLAAAKATTADWQTTPASTFADTHDFLNLRLPESAPLVAAAVAGADLVIAQLDSGLPADAAETFQRVLNTCRGIAPSIALVSTRAQQLESRNPEAIRQELKQALQLSNDDEARRTMSRYRQQVNDMLKAATDRWELQTSLCKKMIAAGLLDPMRSEMESRTASKNPQDPEPYFATPLVEAVAAAYESAGSSTAARDVLEWHSFQAPGQTIPVFPETLVKADPVAAAGMISDRINDKGAGYAAAIEIASRLTRAGNDLSAIAFSLSIRDVLAREECLRQSATIAAANGRASEYWTIATSRVQVPQDLIANASGLIAGMSELDRMEKRATAATATVKDSNAKDSK